VWAELLVAYERLALFPDFSSQGLRIFRLLVSNDVFQFAMYTGVPTLYRTMAVLQEYTHDISSGVTPKPTLAASVGVNKEVQTSLAVCTDQLVSEISPVPAPENTPSSSLTEHPSNSEHSSELGFVDDSSLMDFFNSSTHDRTLSNTNTNSAHPSEREATATDSSSVNVMAALEALEATAKEMLENASLSTQERGGGKKRKPSTQRKKKPSESSTSRHSRKAVPTFQSAMSTGSSSSSSGGGSKGEDGGSMLDMLSKLESDANTILNVEDEISEKPQKRPKQKTTRGRSTSCSGDDSSRSGRSSSGSNNISSYANRDRSDGRDGIEELCTDEVGDRSGSMLNMLSRLESDSNTILNTEEDTPQRRTKRPKRTSAVALKRPKKGSVSLCSTSSTSLKNLPSPTSDVSKSSRNSSRGSGGGGGGSAMLDMLSQLESDANTILNVDDVIPECQLLRKGRRRNQHSSGSGGGDDYGDDDDNDDGDRCVDSDSSKGGHKKVGSSRTQGSSELDSCADVDEATGRSDVAEGGGFVLDMLSKLEKDAILIHQI
jgi:hypothetical protein